MIDTKAWFKTEPCTCAGCETERQRRTERQIAHWFETAASAREIRTFEDVADLIQSAIS